MNIYCFSTLSFAKLQFKSVINKAFHKHGVASFTDAWIETVSSRSNGKRLSRRIFYRCVDWNRLILKVNLLIPVASFTDAWIETVNQGASWIHFWVASFTDAWIETDRYSPNDNERTSHLLQMRGLKPTFWDTSHLFPQSHLLQMRGLKQKNDFYKSLPIRRIFYRCVDWNVLKVILMPLATCRIFYRCVDWNTSLRYSDVENLKSHLLQMRGLKHKREKDKPIP